MRFLGYTLADENAAVPPPPPDIEEKMGKFIEEATAAGVFLIGGGMAPTAEGVIIRQEAGKFTVIDGPFAAAKEIVGGWALMEAPTIEEAIEWSKRFMAIAGSPETRLRPVY
jgi:hypothetical protein